MYFIVVFPIIQSWAFQNVLQPATRYFWPLRVYNYIWTQAQLSIVSEQMVNEKQQIPQENTKNYQIPKKSSNF